jgi:hypothetical protein
VIGSGTPLADGLNPAFLGCDFATAAKITARDLPPASRRV